MRSKDLVVLTGQKLANAAFMRVAEELGISEKDVKARYKRSKLLTLLLAEDGPGTLLQLGTGVDSIWETKLAKEDVQTLLNYRATHLVHLQTQARALDPCASQMLLDAMIAYGWSWGELAKSRSGLAVCLQRYKNLDQLAEIGSKPAITRSLRYPVMGEGSGTSDNKIQNKRRYDGLDNTGRSVKRVQRAEGIEEVDISMMMMQAHTAEYLDITTMMQQAQVLGLDISTMLQPRAPSNLNITKIMQQPLAFRQLDTSMEMQPALNFGRNTDIGGGVACAEVGETGYIGAGKTWADVPGLEPFSDIANDAATPLPGYEQQATANAQQYMLPTHVTTSPETLSFHFEQQEYE
ncbi:hypothetical protein BJ875DRAFT_489391 [Amylocarpus encephaloides]|uniref:Uncharacterized protein n=1 Tax=Amylocarpus encephaloides TaxID=45428 RepID=A0A9P7Y9H9_9HELO|nr:hypothetical protein BJ875DRAFT_489391 [Amylocarpus encephaloides]